KPGFRLTATEQIDAKIHEIEELIPRYMEKKLDTSDLNSEKSRLYKLRNNLGDILQKLKDSLTLDIRESEFERSLARIVKSIEEIPRSPLVGQASASADVTGKASLGAVDDVRQQVSGERTGPRQLRDPISDFVGRTEEIDRIVAALSSVAAAD